MLRIGEWLARLRADPDAAWAELQDSMARSAHRLERLGRLRRGDAEDQAESALLSVLSNGGADAARADPGTALDAWTCGVVERVARRAYGATPRTATLVEVAGTEPDPTDARADDAVAQLRVEADRRLDACGAPPTQREVYRLLMIEGRSIRAATRLLGISRTSFKERLERLVARLRCSTWPDASEKDVSWTDAECARLAGRGDVRGVLVIKLHVAGWTHAAISAETGLSSECVRLKIARARKRSALQAHLAAGPEVAALR